MARKLSKKTINAKPVATEFQSDFMNGKTSKIFIHIEEWEAMRLVDYMGIERVEAGKMMGISRPSLNSLLKSARTKVARALVEGLNFCIVENENTSYAAAESANIERRKIMKVAVVSENGKVFGHFGKAPEFTVFEVENREIISSDKISAPAEGHGAMVGFLTKREVEILICGGIGPGAVNGLKEQGITIYAGASGDVDEQVKALIAGQLNPNGEANCNHHHDGEHECHH